MFPVRFNRAQEPMIWISHGFCQIIGSCAKSYKNKHQEHVTPSTNCNVTNAYKLLPDTVVTGCAVVTNEYPN